MSTLHRSVIALCVAAVAACDLPSTAVAPYTRSIYKLNGTVYAKSSEGWALLNSALDMPSIDTITKVSGTAFELQKGSNYQWFLRCKATGTGRIRAYELFVSPAKEFNVNCTEDTGGGN